MLQQVTYTVRDVSQRDQFMTSYLHKQAHQHGGQGLSGSKQGVYHALDEELDHLAAGWLNLDKLWSNKNVPKGLDGVKRFNINVDDTVSVWSNSHELKHNLFENWLKQKIIITRWRISFFTLGHPFIFTFSKCWLIEDYNHVVEDTVFFRVKEPEPKTFFFFLP